MLDATRRTAKCYKSFGAVRLDDQPLALMLFVDTIAVALQGRDPLRRLTGRCSDHTGDDVDVKMLYFRTILRCRGSNPVPVHVVIAAATL